MHLEFRVFGQFEQEVLADVAHVRGVRSAVGEKGVEELALVVVGLEVGQDKTCDGEEGAEHLGFAVDVLHHGYKFLEDRVIGEAETELGAKDVLVLSDGGNLVEPHSIPVHSSDHFDRIVRPAPSELLCVDGLGIKSFNQHDQELPQPDLEAMLFSVRHRGLLGDVVTLL